MLNDDFLNSKKRFKSPLYNMGLRCYQYATKFWMAVKFYLKWSFDKDKIIHSINAFERKVYSQHGEDGILDIIFYKINTTNKFAVEFGVETGIECLTRYLKIHKGWQVLQMDCNDNLPPEIKNEFITAENINDLFYKYNVPEEFDLLVIDIDSNDYYVWKAIRNYNPRVVVMEYNAKFPPPQSVSIMYNPTQIWDGTDYMGASLSALNKLAKEKGYTLICCDSSGTNAFFVRNDIIKNNFVIKTEEELYMPPGYGVYKNGKRSGHPDSSKKMIEV